jgi:hypothetical protein
VSILLPTNSTGNGLPENVVELVNTLATANRRLRGWSRRAADGEARAIILANIPLGATTAKVFKLAVGSYQSAVTGQDGRR